MRSAHFAARCGFPCACPIVMRMVAFLLAVPPLPSALLGKRPGLPSAQPRRCGMTCLAPDVYYDALLAHNASFVAVALGCTGCLLIVVMGGVHSRSRTLLRLIHDELDELVHVAVLVVVVTSSHSFDVWTLLLSCECLAGGAHSRLGYAGCGGDLSCFVSGKAVGAACRWLWCVGGTSCRRRCVALLCSWPVSWCLACPPPPDSALKRSGLPAIIGDIFGCGTVSSVVLRF